MPQTVEQKKAARRARYLRNREALLAYQKQYHIENQGRRSEAACEWYNKNRDMVLSKRRKYVADNPHLIAEKSAKRRARIAQQTISLSAEHQAKLKQYYRVAALLRHYTGTEWEVDHIAPLRGKSAWGLHVPWNLQVIPMALNRKKSNKTLTYNHR